MKHIPSFDNFLNEEDVNLNEGIKPYDPETVKALTKMFFPLIKHYDMDVKDIRPDGVVEDGGPVINVVTYNVITGGTWTAAQFFNQKDAQACADLLNKTEVGCASKGPKSKEYAAVVRKDTFGKTLFFGELESLNDTAGTKLDMKDIYARAVQACNSLK